LLANLYIVSGYLAYFKWSSIFLVILFVVFWHFFFSDRKVQG